MNRRAVAILFTALAIAAGGATAAQPVTQHPGYFPIETLGLLSPSAIEVDVDLTGPMLRMVSGVLEGDADERAFAALVSRLERIRVQVGAIEGNAGLADTRRRLEEAATRLEGEGWQRMVLVRNGDELVSVYVRGDDQRIDGITVLALDDELALVNLVGAIDPRELGRLLADLDELPALEDLDLDQLPTGGSR